MEKLRLQWHDHGNELSRLSRDLFGHEGLTDVTLTCRGGTPFHAHKMILAAASTYFRNFFLEVQGKIAQHQVIFMKDIESSEMEYLLQFIYLGEVDIPSLELERLIAISKELGIIGLDAVKKEENGGERRTLKATKRKSKTSPESPESLTPKIAKVKNDPIYDEEVDDQDFFDDYMDGGEEDNVTENDVGDKPGNEKIESITEDDKDVSHLEDEGCNREAALSSPKRIGAPAPERGQVAINRTKHKSKFQSHWLNEEEKDDNGDKLVQYVVPDENDKYRAICRVCYKSVNIAWQGKGALVQHARGVIHKERMKTKRGLPTAK